MSTRHRKAGQVSAEVAVLLTVVIAGLVYMGIYLQRGSQGSLKGHADSIGQQFSAQSGWSSYSSQKSKQEVTGHADTTSCSEYRHALNEAGGAGATDAPECTPEAP